MEPGNENLASASKPKYDLTKYHCETNQSLANRYGVAVSTFHVYIQPIQEQLHAMRMKRRPNSVLGSRYWTKEMLILLFDTIGEP